MARQLIETDEEWEKRVKKPIDKRFLLHRSPKKFKEPLRCDSRLLKKHTYFGAADGTCKQCGRTNKQNQDDSELERWFWADAKCSLCSDCAGIIVGAAEDLAASGVRHINFVNQATFLSRFKRTHNAETVSRPASKQAVRAKQVLEPDPSIPDGWLDFLAGTGKSSRKRGR